MASKGYDISELKEEKKILFMKKVIQILEENNINYWITFGALLGYVRQKRLIPWDHDIDIGIFDISKIEKLESKFKDIKLSMKIKYKDLKYETTTAQIKDMTLPKESRFHIDIYEFNLIQGKPVWKYMVRTNILSRTANAIYCSLKSPPSSEKIKKYSIIKKIMIKFTIKIPCFIRPLFTNLFKNVDIRFADKLFLVFPKLKTRTVDFYGMKVKIPVEPEKHLKIIYGENWKTPDKSFKSQGLESIKYKEKGIKICKLQNEQEKSRKKLVKNP